MCYIRCATDPSFPAKVLFTDEASFTWKGIFNTLNSYFWAVEKPHAAQSRFLVNVWAGIVGDHLIGPY
ncbi:hypothetical protein AVEN_83158-1 [Araneus ventricosus]|uniref:DDE-1 domain-containing protein n=1 Tax=Araneus ventricosus TaxID=182803 RepID=A0A4Y2AMR1_ARAVE|nr:hypothetical protein AVEN_83158-1 [Araneus ventricosus]